MSRSERSATKKPLEEEPVREMMSIDDALELYIHDYNEMIQVMFSRIQYCISLCIELQITRMKLSNKINDLVQNFANRMANSTHEEEKQFFAKVIQILYERLTFDDNTLKYVEKIFSLFQEKKEQLEIGFNFLMQRIEEESGNEDVGGHQSSSTNLKRCRKLDSGGRSDSTEASATAASIRRSSTRRSVKSASTNSKNGQASGSNEPASECARTRSRSTRDEKNTLYCTCRYTSYGEMVCCDNAQCRIQWFHFPCVKLDKTPKGKWYCKECRGERTNAK